MNLKRAIKKILRELGLELKKDQIADLAEEVEDLIDSQVNVQSNQDADDADDDEEKGDDETDEVKKLKAELNQLKIGSAVEAELKTWGIAEGYEDTVKNMIDFSDVIFENGELKGLKEKREEIAKDKALLFTGKQSYTPSGGGSVTQETDVAKAMKQENFNFTEFIKNLQESD